MTIQSSILLHLLFEILYYADDIPSIAQSVLAPESFLNKERVKESYFFE